jgi:hypothetical protein
MRSPGMTLPDAVQSRAPTRAHRAYTASLCQGPSALAPDLSRIPRETGDRLVAGTPWAWPQRHTTMSCGTSGDAYENSGRPSHHRHRLGE